MRLIIRSIAEVLKKILRAMPFLHVPMRNIRDKYVAWHYSRIKEEEYPKHLARYYKYYMGEKLDWNNLKTYNEKLQWLKLYDNTPIKTILSDKYKVRQWITEKIGEEYLVPMLGVWKNADDIDFNALPNQFVLKANHASGFNIIVRDKEKLNIKKTRKQLNVWLKINYAFCVGAFNLFYRDIPPRIVAEKYIEQLDGDLYDYKFLCFDGEPRYCWVDVGRHTTHKRSIYNLEWEPQPFKQHTYSQIESSLPKPKNFDQMVAISKTLCEGFKHVRVDLYNVNGKIYFGEMTFVNGGGIERISPLEYNRALGDMIKL